MPILLKNATYIDWESLEFKKTHIIVNEGIDGSIFFSEAIPDTIIETIIDCNNLIVTKSFACGHHHIYSALSRGMPAPKKNPQNFYQILEYIWWNLDKKLDKDMIEASALATAIACAKAGSTFIIDHHASPYAIEGSLEIIAKAIEKIGLSHLLCYENTNRDGYEVAEKGLIESENYLQKYQGLVGLHASFTVSNELLTDAVNLAKKYNSGIHIHVAEDQFDQTHCLREHKMTVMERLYRAGALSFSKTILGHCLHINNNERGIFTNSEAWIAQNSESNMNNNVGFFSSEWLGSRIFLGTDGMHSDMLRSAKAAFYVGRSQNDIDFPTAYKRFRQVHNYLKINNFKGDGDNNLVILDYTPPTDFNQQNFLGHFLFGLDSCNVKHLISNGKLILQDRKIINVNEQEIMQFAQEQGRRLWEKL